MKYIVLLIISISLLSGCGKSDIDSSDIVVNDNVKVTLHSDESKVKQEKVIIENYNIVDVTQGKEIRGIKTQDTKGFGKAAFQDDTYSLAVMFENLPQPKNGDFYEGWIVQKEPFKFISTGKLRETNAMQVNTFTNKQNYSSYDFYVLTLEPDDNDPAPADHILEGTLEF